MTHEVRGAGVPTIEPPSATIDANAAIDAESGAAGATLEPYEVFRQEKEGDPMRHGGSVMAPDPELAAIYARELYGRRQESQRLWIVRRADIAELDDPDLLQPPLDRSYKKPGGYVMRDKLAQARERVGTEKPKPRAAGRAQQIAAQPSAVQGGAEHESERT